MACSVLKTCYFFVSVTLLLPAVCYCQSEAYTYYSRATYYGSPDCYGTASGACGYGEYGRTIYDGKVSGVSRLYRNGTGCGACYQVKCKIPKHCNDQGTKIVVTDYGEGDRTDFILSSRAYMEMAAPNMAAALLAYGVVDVEFQRIPCRFYGYNLLFKVHEHSKNPSYLALIPLYQSGSYDITAVELWQEECKEWRGMRKAYGAVWDMANPPAAGEVSLRFQVSSYGDVKWMQLPNFLPSNWKAGVVYDTSVLLD